MASDKWDCRLLSPASWRRAATLAGAASEETSELAVEQFRRLDRTDMSYTGQDDQLRSGYRGVQSVRDVQWTRPWDHMHT
jgi:hypothetical protein